MPSAAIPPHHMRGSAARYPSATRAVASGANRSKDVAKKMFTEAGLERLRAPDKGRVEYGDSVVPGLMLRISETGVKSWSVLYKVKGEGGASPRTGRPMKGTQRRISLGQYPILGVKQAREAAIDVLQKSLLGTDARVVRNEALLARGSNTVEAVAKRFIDQDAKPNIESWSKIERAFELHVYPEWRDRTLADIRRRDVHALLDGLIAKGKTGTASDVRKHLSRLFNWAIDREIIAENPLSGLEAQGPAVQGRRRPRAHRRRAAGDLEGRPAHGLSVRSLLPADDPDRPAADRVGRREALRGLPQAQGARDPEGPLQGPSRPRRAAGARGLGHLRRDAPLERRRPLPLQHPGRRSADLRLLEGQDVPRRARHRGAPEGHRRPRSRCSGNIVFTIFA